MIMWPQSFDNDVVDSSDSSSASVLLLDASPSNFGAPTGVFVKAPFANLHYQVTTLRQAELRFWKWKPG